MIELKPGVYRHYKGKNYRVLFVATDTESGEDMVIYEPLYDTGTPYRCLTRSRQIFSEEVEVAGVRLPRFAYVGESLGEQPVVQPLPKNTDMQKLVTLLSLLQLTKEQPLTGYLASGIKLYETATLAEHHYTTTLSAYFLTRKIQNAGGIIDSHKVILMTLIHDLGELFGGDIAGPLNRKYPDLREYKNKIGDRAFDMLSNYLAEPERLELVALYNEYEHGDTDEAVVGRIMDQMDHQLFLEHHNYRSKASPNGSDYRIDFVKNHVYDLTSKLRDPVTKRIMDEFLAEYNTNFFCRGYQPLSVLME